jgi:hypothetical protein
MKADQVEYEFLGLWVPEDMKARVPELSPVQPFRQPRDLIGCNLTRLDCVTMKELVQTASHPLIQGRIGMTGQKRSGPFTIAAANGQPSSSQN